MTQWFETLFDDEFAAIWFEPRLGETTEREAAAILEMTNTGPGARILDVPCGVGRHCVAMAQRGHACVGVDLADRYIEAARQAAKDNDVSAKCSFLVGNMRELRALGITDFEGGFDLAMSFFSSFGYFADEADDLAVLRGYFDALKPGGALVIDSQCKETVLAKPRPCFAYRRGETLVVEEREYDPLADRLQSEWTLVRDDKAVRRASMNIRLYSVREWHQMLRDTGFGDVEMLDGFPGKPFRVAVSGRLALVARKP
jgi:SAM-dependent methyltransferase